jgi:AsmA protein
MLLGNDLDGAISRFDSSQNFNLVDVGAVFLAGPLGLAVTKGYNFGSLFRGTGGTTRLGIVVSDWRVERGVAHARDVALATPRNRLALQGGLDFASGRFADMTVAVVDAKGCPRLQQTIRGPFGKPEVGKPSAFKSAAGPFVKLFHKARNLFPSGPCKVFYAGSVAHPA